MVSDIFYAVDFSLTIILCSVSLVVSVLIIIIVISKRQLRTYNNILTCNTYVASIFYCLITIVGAIYGFNEEWSSDGWFCSLRAYLFNVSIAAICHSKSTHSISRLFFSVFYKHRYLLTWKTHRILILFNWLICLIICLPPFFISNGYQYEKESRSCVISTKTYWLALYISVISCIIPFNIIIFIYLIILSYVYRSSRRIHAFNQNLNHTHRNKRQIKLMKTMLIQTYVLISGGPIFLFLVVWHATQTIAPPDYLYLLAFNLITIVSSTVSILQVIMNKQLRLFIKQFFKRRHSPISILIPTHTRQQVWNIA